MCLNYFLTLFSLVYFLVPCEIDARPSLLSVKAIFNAKGLRGYVLFTEKIRNDTTESEDEIVLTVEYHLQNWQWTGPLVKDDIFIVIREFPVPSYTPTAAPSTSAGPAPSDRCSDEALGKQLFSRDFQIGPLRLNETLKGTLDNIVGVPLRGPKSIRGRSLLLISSKNRRFCATISAINLHEMRTAVAQMQGGIAGDIYFRQFATIPSDTSIYVDLYKLIPDGVPNNMTYKWLLMTTGPLDRTRPEDQVSCRNMRVLFDPDFRSEENCSPEHPENCKVGNMIAKFGGLSIGLVSVPQRAFFTDPNFSLTGWSEGRGIYVAIFSPFNPLVSVACGEVRLLRPKMAQVSFSEQGVQGAWKFRQGSPFDPTEVYVNLKGLGKRGSKVAIHQFPRRQKVLIKEDLCTSKLIGEIFDPLSQIGKRESQNIRSPTTDQLAIGDLSAKYGDILDLNEVEKEFVDDSMPLFGAMSVVGRSVVIYNVNSSRWICSNIFSEEENIMAQVDFFYTVGGRISLRQSSEDWRSETTIVGDLYYTNNVLPNFTRNHSWRVHSGKVQRDAFTYDSRCTNAQDVYNPLGIDTRKNYATECRASRPVRCELGDLAAKVGPLLIALKSSIGNGRFFFTVSHLPLTGPFSIVGRSIVIYEKEFGTERMACGNVVLVHPVKAASKEWIGGNGKVSGFFSAMQPSGMQDTSVHIGLEGLARATTTMTVHIAPVEPELVIPCTEESIGKDFNPFNVTRKAYDNLTSYTDDAVAVGDLSLKYGSLSGLTSYARQKFDANLPLTGPFSIIGRSIGIREEKEERSWACADIVHDIEGLEKVILFRAVAEFPGPFLWGYVRFTQVHYLDSSNSSSAVTIEVRLAHMVNDSIDYERASTGHRWTINQLPVATDAAVIWESFRCITAGLMDNYFNTATESEEYRRECWVGNPQRCTYGDVTSRLGTLDIAFNARQVFTDEILQLRGNISLVGRSVVIYDTKEDGSILREVRLACANILEEETAMTTMNLLQTGTFDSVGFEDRVARLANLSSWNIFIEYGKIQKLYQNSCTQVKLHFRAPKAQALMRTFTNFMDLDQFKYVGYDSCDKRKEKQLMQVAADRASGKQSAHLDDSGDESAADRIHTIGKTILLFSLVALYVL